MAALRAPFPFGVGGLATSLLSSVTRVRAEREEGSARAWDRDPSRYRHRPWEKLMMG